jgi:hypothetical protein
MALQDLENGNGFALIDPLGDLAERLVSRIPNSRRNDVIYFNAADRGLTWGYNPLRHVPSETARLKTAEMMDYIDRVIAMAGELGCTVQTPEEAGFISNTRPPVSAYDDHVSGNNQGL